MLLSWFLVLLSISLVLVILGLWRPEHSELSLIGFFFLFLLSLSLINSDLQYKTGENATTSYTYSSGNLTGTFEQTVDNYSTFSDSNQHNYGYWMAIGSAVGFIIILVGLGRSKKNANY